MLHRLVSDFSSHSFVPSLWHGEMEVHHKLCGNFIQQTCEPSKGKTRRVREVSESSYDRCVQQQSEKMKPIYPDVLLLIL